MQRRKALQAQSHRVTQQVQSQDSRRTNTCTPVLVAPITTARRWNARRPTTGKRGAARAHDGTSPGREKDEALTCHAEDPPRRGAQGGPSQKPHTIHSHATCTTVAFTHAEQTFACLELRRGTEGRRVTANRCGVSGTRCRCPHAGCGDGSTHP